MKPEKEQDFYPEPYPLSPEERAAAIAKLKASFTAADLQRFTEVEEGILLDDVIAELERIHHETAQEAR